MINDRSIECWPRTGRGRARKIQGRRLIKFQHGRSRHLHQLASLTRNMQQASQMGREKDRQRRRENLLPRGLGPRVLWMRLKARAAVTATIFTVTVGTVTVFIGDWHHDRGVFLVLARCLHHGPASTVTKRDASVVVVLLSFLLGSLVHPPREPNGPTAFLRRIPHALFCRIARSSTCWSNSAINKKKVPRYLRRDLSRDDGCAGWRPPS